MSVTARAVTDTHTHTHTDTHYEYCNLAPACARLIIAVSAFVVTLSGPVTPINEPAPGQGPVAAMVCVTVTAAPTGGTEVDVILTLGASDGAKAGKR